MMKFIINGEPYVFQHTCPPQDKGKPMNDEEKRRMLIDNLLDIYNRCQMPANRYEVPKKSFWQKVIDSRNIVYPDICINNFHGSNDSKAYYYVRPLGDRIDINPTNLPDDIKSSWVKVIYGSVFCLEQQKPDVYVKGCHYAAQYSSEAILPVQSNYNLPQMLSDKELAEKYVESWKKLDADIIVPFLDKDFHYSSDAVFDEMSSRDEYIDYLIGKFRLLQERPTIARIELGRNGEDGEWAALIKQILNDGTPIVCGFFIKSEHGRIQSIEVHEMDLPDF